MRGKHYWFGGLLVLWLIIHAYMVARLGIIATGDAEKYNEEAIYFLQTGAFTENRFWLYSFYVLCRAFFIYLGIPLVGMYLFQLVLNGLATICFYQLAYKITGTMQQSLMATALLIICFTYQRWTVFMITESLFCSLIIIFSWAFFVLPRAWQGKYFLLLITFVPLLFTRPSGLYFLLILIPVIFYLFRKRNKSRNSIPIIAGILFLFTGLVLFGLRNATMLDFVKPFAENNVLCYIPELPPAGEYQPGGNPVQNILEYVINNPVHTLWLMFKRFLSYWGMLRSHYSFGHNLSLALFFYPIYLLALFGIPLAWKRNRVFTIYSISIFIVFTLSVLLTCDDWNNRFIMPLLPFIFILAAMGITRITRIFFGPFGKTEQA